MAGRYAVDMTGQVFGKLLVLRRAEASGSDAVWICLCECGTEAPVRRFNLLNGQRSCGCHLWSAEYRANRALAKP
jgi:hypothetical protein